MSEQSTNRHGGAVENTVTPSTDTVTVERAAAESGRGGGGGLMSGSFGRNLGLVVALLLICAAGVITAGDRFASIDNILTILRFASTIGVVSIGMTFVITGGGIDLSVGAILALCSVWATTFATQTMAEDTHWLLMVFVALAVGCRLRARQRSADRLRQGRPVHHDAGDARCRARSRRDHLRAAYADRDASTASRTSSPPTCSACRSSSSSSRSSPSPAGSCSTARRSAGARSPSAATPRRHAWPASTSTATPCCSTCSSASAAGSPP